MSANSTLFTNAVASIELGVEDYRSPDPRRAASAIRNFHAGVLLLMKECLGRADPALISARLRPQLANGVVSWQGHGMKTVDVPTMAARWKSLGWEPIKQQPLDDLTNIRNNVEHHSTQVPEKTVRQALTDTFCVVAQLLTDHLGESPVTVFDGDTWEAMRDEAETHRLMVETCRKSRLGIQGIPAGMAVGAVRNQLDCPDCGSELLRLIRVGDEHPEADLICEACGGEVTTGQGILNWVDHQRIGETRDIARGGEARFGQCPHCWEESYSLEEDQCLVCCETRAFTSCARCEESLALYEQSTGLCGYCQHIWDKD